MAVGLLLAEGCDLLSAPTLPPQGADAEVELVSGKAWAKPAIAAGWTEFHGRFSLLFGDQVGVLEEATSPAELRLADGTIVRLEPGTVLQLVQPPPPDSRPVFRLVEGSIAVDAVSADQWFDIYVSATESFTYEFLNFTVLNQQAGTTFRLWLDGTTAHLVMGTEGQVQVSTEEDEATLEPEWEAWAELDGEIHIRKPRQPDTPTPTRTATPTHSATPTPTATPRVTPTPTATWTHALTSTLTPTLTPTSTPTGAAGQKTPTSPVTPTPTVKATVSLPQLYQAPLLMEPYHDQVFGFNMQQLVTLLWVPTPLAKEHWYQVQLWQEGESPGGSYWTKENWWDLGPTYYPGDYYWRVIIVEGQEDKTVGAVSPPSETRFFEWIAELPTPTPAPRPTDTPRPTNTPVPPTNTPIPPTNTPVPTPTDTPRPTPSG